MEGTWVQWWTSLKENGWDLGRQSRGGCKEKNVSCANPARVEKNLCNACMLVHVHTLCTLGLVHCTPSSQLISNGANTMYRSWGAGGLFSGARFQALLNIWSCFWMVLCGGRGWTRWALWFCSNMGYSVTLLCGSRSWYGWDRTEGPLMHQRLFFPLLLLKFGNTCKCHCLSDRAFAFPIPWSGGCLSSVSSPHFNVSGKCTDLIFWFCLSKISACHTPELTAEGKTEARPRGWNELSLLVLHRQASVRQEPFSPRVRTVPPQRCGAGNGRRSFCVSQWMLAITGASVDV